MSGSCASSNFIFSKTRFKPCCRVVACRPQRPPVSSKHLVGSLLLDKSEGRRQTNCINHPGAQMCLYRTDNPIYKNTLLQKQWWQLWCTHRKTSCLDCTQLCFLWASFERLIVFYLCFYYRMSFIHSRLMSIWQDQLPSSGWTAGGLVAGPDVVVVASAVLHFPSSHPSIRSPLNPFLPSYPWLICFSLPPPLAANSWAALSAEVPPHRAALSSPAAL